MIRFYNGKVLRFTPDIRLTEEEVWVDGSRIVYIGPACAPVKDFERQIDLCGDMLMPGFKNAHAHTAMVFLRSLADDMELQRWLSEIVWPNEAKLSDESIYFLTKNALVLTRHNYCRKLFLLPGHQCIVNLREALHKLLVTAFKNSVFQHIVIRIPIIHAFHPD